MTHFPGWLLLLTLLPLAGFLAWGALVSAARRPAGPVTHAAVNDVLFISRPKNETDYPCRVVTDYQEIFVLRGPSKRSDNNQ